jgi:2'-hydroxyisoflavone reductase
LIVGPHDPSDRFTYWVNRISKGGRVICPGDGNTPIQFIDVRDLARWSVEMADGGQPGLYNGTGPEYVLSMGNFLQTCKDVCNPEAELVWINEKFLMENEVLPWTEMTCWAPESQKEHFGLGKIDISKAIKNDLRFTDLKTTITETNEWDKNRNKNVELRAGISSEKEKNILKMYESVAEKL